jgi:hypothetical protein
LSAVVTCCPVGRRGGWKPFLHHISKNRPQARRAIALPAPEKLPRVLSAAEIQAILDACKHLRDRFFFALLHDSGLFSIGRSLAFSRSADYLFSYAARQVWCNVVLGCESAGPWEPS